MAIRDSKEARGVGLVGGERERWWWQEVMSVGEPQLQGQGRYSSWFGYSIRIKEF